MNFLNKELRESGIEGTTNQIFNDYSESDITHIISFTLPISLQMSIKQVGESGGNWQ